MVKWNIRNQIMVIKSNVNAEYKVKAHSTVKMMWALDSPRDVDFKIAQHIILNYDSYIIINIISNLVFHERTKHIAVDFHSFEMWCYHISALLLILHT